MGYVRKMMSSTGVLSINLSAIQKNWLYVSSLLKAPSLCAAVVKANAYGVGAIEVAKALSQVGCHHYYVVTLEEACEIRAVLPDATVYVLGGVRSGSENIFAENNLIPVLYTLELVDRWMQYCASVDNSLPCVIKIDTGMTRLGLSEIDVDILIDRVQGNSYFNPVVLMSHLACADEPEHNLNKIQLDQFSDAILKLKKVFPNIKTSLANSSGSFLGEAYHFDMVRIGAALYGINPQPSTSNPLHQVVQLKLPILQYRITQENVSVGYGGATIVAPGVRLAVAAGGYADGIHRTLGSTPCGRIENKMVYALGRISMDSCIFDISNCEIDAPQFIHVIDEHLTLDYLMKTNKFLGYEVLTSLGKRFNRQYVYSSDAQNEQ